MLCMTGQLLYCEVELALSTHEVPGDASELSFTLYTASCMFCVGKMRRNSVYMSFTHMCSICYQVSHQTISTSVFISAAAAFATPKESVLPTM